MSILYAFLAAIVWGLEYSVAEKIFEKLDVKTFIFIEFVIGTIVFGLLLFFSKGNIMNDITNIFEDKKLLLFTSIATITFILGNLLIFYSINEGNATIAGIIEISYPIFIIIFSYIFFKEKNFNWYIILGGLLIFIGIIIISLGNRGNT